MRGVTRNLLNGLRRLKLVDTGALARTCLLAISLAGCSAAVPDAEKALSAASKKADGVYGISPITLQLRASNKANFSNLNVYASVSGAQVPLSTNFNTGYIENLTEYTSYMLKVHGVAPGNVETPLPIVEYQTRTWDTFDRSTWSMELLSTSTTDGSSYRVTWDYVPWRLVPPGDGAREGAEMNCYFVPDAGVGTDPFVPSAKRFRAMLNEGHLIVSSGTLGLAGNVRGGCEATFIDGYTSRHTLRIVKNFAPAIKPCPSKTVKMYDLATDPFSCTLGMVGGQAGGADLLTNPDYSLSLDTSAGAPNYCSFIEEKSTGNLAPMTNMPTDDHFGTCRLDYVLNGPGGYRSAPLTSFVTVENVRPAWVSFPSSVPAIREISPNDPALADSFVGGVVQPVMIMTHPGYYVNVTDGQIQINKEGLSSAGKYQLVTAGITNSCATRGSIYHVVSGTPVAGINAGTGAFYFMPNKHFFGTCTMDIEYDDKHGVTTPPTARSVSDRQTLTINVQGYNDPPTITAPQLNPSGRYACEGDGCFVGIDKEMSIGASVGGSNLSDGLNITETGQNIYVDTGNCVSTHPEILRVNYCQLDEGGRLVLSFAPLKMPTTEDVRILIRVTDTGLTSMPSATFPNTLPTYKPVDHCLAAAPPLSQPNSCRTNTPGTNLDSATLNIPIVIKDFNLPMQPALIVSKGACVICHANVIGDVITDMGNSPSGSRFANILFRPDPTDNSGHNGWLTNRATYLDGWLHIGKIVPSTGTTGRIFVKRAKLTAAQNPDFFRNVSFKRADGVGFRASGDPDANFGSFYNEANLLDFLRAPRFKITATGVNDTPWKNADVAATYMRSLKNGPGGNETKMANTGPDPMDVRDTLLNNDPIDYMQISAPLVSDIQFIAENEAAPGSSGDAIAWGPGTGPGVGALYRVPTAGSSVEPRPFSGLNVTTRQPLETVRNIRANSVPPYVTNDRNVPIECYGDVVVKGNLFLTNPTFHTDRRGCRIHVTGDVVFHSYLAPHVNGRRPSARGMEVLNVNPGAVSTDHFGVQITSASSVVFGSSQFHMGPTNPSRHVPATALAFARDSLKVPDGRECFNASGVLDTISNCPSGYISFAQGIGDTETNPNSPDYRMQYPSSLDGWDYGPVDYEGLMVNAPVISSRYLGRIKGSVIGDYVIARLGALVFEFDPRFQTQVPFPRLQMIPLNNVTGQVPRKVFDAGPCTNPNRWECNNGPK